MVQGQFQVSGIDFQYVGNDGTIWEVTGTLVGPGTPGQQGRWKIVGTELHWSMFGFATACAESNCHQYH